MDLRDTEADHLAIQVGTAQLEADWRANQAAFAALAPNYAPNHEEYNSHNPGAGQHAHARYKNDEQAETPEQTADEDSAYEETLPAKIQAHPHCCQRCRQEYAHDGSGYYKPLSR